MKIGNIKFKAKRLDGKGWIEGTPICINRKPSFKPFLHLRDSEIKKIINQFNRYKI